MSRDQVVTKDQRYVHTTECHLVEQAWLTTEGIKNVSTATAQDLACNKLTIQSHEHTIVPYVVNTYPFANCSKHEYLRGLK